MDPGSVVLAASLATVGASLVHLAFRHARWALLDIPMTLGRRLADDPPVAFAAGLVLHLLFGVGWGFAYAGAWALSGLPIGAGQGALFAVPHWVLSEAAIGVALRFTTLGARTPFAPRRAAWATLVSHLAFGGLVGLLYRPGT